jgi:hypothetical protein
MASSNQQPACLKIGNIQWSSQKTTAIACKIRWSYILQNVGPNENYKVPSVFLPYKAEHREPTKKTNVVNV